MLALRLYSVPPSIRSAIKLWNELPLLVWPLAGLLFWFVSVGNAMG